MPVAADAARVRGFIFETPRGERKLAANVDFNDHQIWAHRSDFDGREVVQIWAPQDGGGWSAHDTTWRGQSPGMIDLHAATVNVGRGGVDPVSLMQYGLAAMATIDGPLAGAQIVHLQDFGKNGKVHDVGRVDNFGVGWAGNLHANHISGRHQSRQPLQNGETVKFSASSFGRPGNLRFEFDVFAPEHTPRYGASREAKSDAIRQMNLRVESPFIPGGSQSLDYIHNVGPEGNNFRVAFQLADSNLFQGPPRPSGTYPVRLIAGDRVVADVVLDWHDGR